MSGEPRVVVLVTEGCHLCEDACEVVGQVCDELRSSGSRATLIDAGRAASIKRVARVRPVVLIDGEVHDIFRVTADRLRAALTVTSS